MNKVIEIDNVIVNAIALKKLIVKLTKKSIIEINKIIVESFFKNSYLSIWFINSTSLVYYYISYTKSIEIFLQNF